MHGFGQLLIGLFFMAYAGFSLVLAGVESVIYWLWIKITGRDV